MRTLYEINDNTGSHKVIFYKKGDNEQPKALKNFEFKENIWVKVKGTVRVFKEETAVIGQHIREIEQHDEVTNHFLQIFLAHQIRRKGVLSQDHLNSRSNDVANIRNRSGMPNGGASDPDQSILEIMQNLRTAKNMQFVDKNILLKDCRMKGL